LHLDGVGGAYVIDIWKRVCYCLDWKVVVVVSEAMDVDEMIDGILRAWHGWYIYMFFIQLPGEADIILGVS
jgi:hypothetical protein